MGFGLGGISHVQMLHGKSQASGYCNDDIVPLELDASNGPCTRLPSCLGLPSHAIIDQMAINSAHSNAPGRATRMHERLARNPSTESHLNSSWLKIHNTGSDFIEHLALALACLKVPVALLHIIQLERLVNRHLEAAVLQPGEDIIGARHQLLACYRVVVQLGAGQER